MGVSPVLETSPEYGVTVGLRLALLAAVRLSQSLWFTQSCCPFFPSLVGPWDPWISAIYRSLPGDRSGDHTFQHDPCSVVCHWWDTLEKAHKQWVAHSWRETPEVREENKECLLCWRAIQRSWPCSGNWCKLNLQSFTFIFHGFFNSVCALSILGWRLQHLLGTVPEAALKNCLPDSCGSHRSWGFTSCSSGWLHEVDWNCRVSLHSCFFPSDVSSHVHLLGRLLCLIQHETLEREGFVK